MYAASGRELFLFLARQLPGQLSYFAAGMAWHLVPDRSPTNLARIFFMSAALFLVALFTPLVAVWIMPAAVGGIIIALAYWPSRISRLEDFGDLSYGVYVYHFPILQALVALGAFGVGAHGFLGAGLGVGLVFVFAAMSWFWLEGPMLKAKRAKSGVTKPMLQPSELG
jgi:peptidoglycan/LPS O-acetylase OafA/YrhL